MVRKFLSVDPGFHTGLASWGPDGLIIGSLNVSSGKNIETDEDKLKDMIVKFNDFLNDLTHEPDLCLIEGVENWGGSLKSRTASVRGDLSKLSYLVGGYCCVCFSRGISVRLVSPRQWKGNLPKLAVESRVRRLIDIEGKVTDHVIDAIGIGLAYQGKL